MNLRILTLFFAMAASSSAPAEPIFWCSLGTNNKVEVSGSYGVARGCSQTPCNAQMRLSGTLSGQSTPFQYDLYGTYADYGLFIVSGNSPNLSTSIEVRVDFQNDGTARRQSYLKIGDISYPMFCRYDQYHGCPSGMSCGH